MNSRDMEIAEAPLNYVVMPNGPEGALVTLPLNRNRSKVLRYVHTRSYRSARLNRYGWVQSGCQFSADGRTVFYVHNGNLTYSKLPASSTDYREGMRSTNCRDCCEQRLSAVESLGRAILQHQTSEPTATLENYYSNVFETC